MSTTESPAKSQFYVNIPAPCLLPTSYEEHFTLLLDCAHAGLLVLVVFFGDVYGFLDVSKNEIAVGIVGLYLNISTWLEVLSIHAGSSFAGTYVKSALQFAVAAQFYDDDLIDTKAHKVEGLVGLFFFFHGGQDGGVVACGVAPRNRGRSELWQERSSWRNGSGASACTAY